MSKETLNSITLSPEMETFLEEVNSRTEGYDVYLGGGYYRDHYYNAIKFAEFKSLFKEDEAFLFTQPMTPKDIDLFFVPKENYTGTRTLPTLPKTYINYDKSSVEMPDMEERGVDRVRGLFVPSLSETSDVQFIVYKKHITQEQLAADMDCNCNQVMFSLETGFRYATEAFYVGHENEEIEMLHTFDYIRMAKRLVRMKNKFPDYDIVGDWDLSEFADTVMENGGSFCE